MKKLWTALICGALILSSAFGLAAIDGNKISIGGIAPGMSETKLLDTFGQPVYRDGDEWTYKNFRVEVERGVIEEVSTCSETLNTPDGVRVGLAAETINSTFGKADKIDRERDSVEYEYYSTDRSKKIEFKVVKGIIAKISCKLVD